MAEATVLSDLLLQAAETSHGVRFLQGGDRETRYEYATLLQRARSLLGHWQQQGMQSGDAVVLFVRDNRAFLDAFWACQLGGLVAVPLSAGAQSAALGKLAAIGARFDAPWLFSERLLRQRLWQDHDGAALFAGRVSLMEDVPADSAPGVEKPSQPGDITLIQFSSGSTSEPKGVQLSHASLLANLRAITRAAAIGEGDITFSWMPLSHDMGLVGFHLVPLYNGLEQVLMDSELFVRRPALWLQRASDLGATLLCSPNFGYRHYLQRVTAPGAEIRLDRVRLLFSGAEPVSAQVCREFAQRLASCGLRPETLFPVYGLAEASLAVCFPQPGSGVQAQQLAADSLAAGDAVRAAASGERKVELVSLGFPVDSCEVRIADEKGGAVPAGHVGRVQIRGESVTRGYYRCPSCDRDAFVDDWLDTGDLGFMGKAGLVICGRAKEVIFAAGQNIYPPDVEHMLEQAGCVPAGKVAVTALRSDDNAEDRLLVFVQYRGELDDFVPGISVVQAALAADAGMQAHAVIPVPRLPHTTSGKLQRLRLAEAFGRGDYTQTLAAFSTSPAVTEAGETADDTARQLMELCRRRFPGQALTLDQNLFELGADSLTLVSLHEDIDNSYPGKVEITDVFDYPTVRALAAYIDRS
jgi:acyl-CoA synthetase (AMP-forming)/AMP-acid ligase II/acyl carrier protein